MQSISAAMAEFYLERLSLNEATTKEDLQRAGYSADQISTHAATASEIAGKKLRSNTRRKAA